MVHAWLLVMLLSLVAGHDATLANVIAARQGVAPEGKEPVPASGWIAEQASAGWGLVLGADKSPKSAQDEVAAARRSLGVDAKIYRCGSWYRTIAVFKDRRSVMAALKKARISSPYNPYVVDMNIWCPSKRDVR